MFPGVDEHVNHHENPCNKKQRTKKGLYHNLIRCECVTDEYEPHKQEHAHPEEGYPPLRLYLLLIVHPIKYLIPYPLVDKVVQPPVQITL